MFVDLFTFLTHYHENFFDPDEIDLNHESSHIMKYFVDIWEMGTILLELLIGYPSANNTDENHRRINSVIYGKCQDPEMLLDPSAEWYVPATNANLDFIVKLI